MGSNVDNAASARAHEIGLYNPRRPSTAAALCMV